MLRTAIAFALLLAPSSVWAATGYTHNEARQNRLNKRLGTSTNPQVTVQGSVCTVKVSSSQTAVYTFLLM